MFVGNSCVGLVQLVDGGIDPCFVGPLGWILSHPKEMFVEN